MLRPSPVLTPPPANSSPNTFRYAPAQSPPTLSRPINSTPTPSRSAAAAARLASSPRLAAPSAEPRRRHTSLDPAAPAATSSTETAAASSGAMAATANDSVHTMPPSRVPPAAEPSATSGTAGSLKTAAPSATQQSAAGNDDSTTDTSPFKRRGEAIETGNAAHTEPADADSTQPAKRARQDEQPPKVLPIRYELCAVEDIVELIAHMLNELIATNDAIRTTSGGLTRFHSRAAPGISVRDYLHRLAKHATLIPPLLLSMVYYIDRLCALYPEFTINTLTVHRFLITAATVAAKGLSDSFWNNTTYARVGGVRLAELKMLELEFLYRVDWKIVPNPEVLVAYYRGLVERTPGYVLEGDEAGDEMDDGLDEDDEE